MHHLITCYLDGYRSREQIEEIKELFMLSANREYDSVSIERIDQSFYADEPDQSFRFQDYRFLSDLIEDQGVAYHEHWLSSGYFMWKPYFIFKKLQQIPLGQYLHYHDFDVTRYPIYLDNLKLSPRLAIQRMANFSVLLYKEYGKQVCHDIKMLLLQKYGLSLTAFGIWAGSISLRHDPDSLAFMRNWCDYASPENCLPIPDVPLSGRHKAFTYNSADQAVLTVLALSRPQIIKRAWQLKYIFNRDIGRSSFLAFLDFIVSIAISKIAKVAKLRPKPCSR